MQIILQFYLNSPIKLIKIAVLNFVLITLLAGNCYGQSITWQRVLDNGYGSINKVQQTSDGGYIAVGSDRMNNEYKIYLVKFDYLGKTLWTERIGIGEAHGYWVEETTDKGFIIGGDVYIGSSQVYLVKTDEKGNVLWQRNYINSDLDQCQYVKQTSDNGYILGCRTQIGIINGILLIKTDSLGNMQCQKIYSTFPKHTYIREIEFTNNGYLICGSTAGNGPGTSDVYLLRVNQNGDSIWAKIYGGATTDAGYALELLGNYGFLIGGYSNSFNTSNLESYLIKTDTAGNIIWQRTYSGLYGEESYCVKYRPGVGYIMAGYSDTDNFLFARAMIKIVDTSGNVIRQKTYFPASRGGWFNDVELTSDGGYILGGAANNNSFIKMYIAKTDSMLDAEPIGISNTGNYLPTEFHMSQNYPNPFNPFTNINFSLAKSSIIKINLYDLTGKLTKEVVNKYLPAGNHNISIDFDLFGISSGVYFYSAYINNSIQPISSKKMIFLK